MLCKFIVDVAKGEVGERHAIEVLTSDLPLSVIFVALIDQKSLLWALECLDDQAEIFDASVIINRAMGRVLKCLKGG